jgi:uncharacterized protein
MIGFMESMNYGDQVVMKDTLDAALSALFSEGGAGTATTSAATGAPSGSATTEGARNALDRYNQAIERLKSGDWAGFGTELDTLRELLQQMSSQGARGK